MKQTRLQALTEQEKNMLTRYYVKDNFFISTDRSQNQKVESKPTTDLMVLG